MAIACRAPRCRPSSTTSPRAQWLRKLFKCVASLLNLQLDEMVTDGSQPIGCDVMRVLRSEPDAPADLREKSLRLAGRVIEFDPDVRGGDGWRIARDILESGRALAQMEALIDAQGRRAELPALGTLTHELPAPQAGTVAAIDNLQLARIARLAGAPQVPGAGADLLRKVGEPVLAGQALYRIHACYPADLEFARDLAARDSGYRLE
jgi:thymidine phosphorylase